jgi:cell division protein FtsQ
VAAGLKVTLGAGLILATVLGISWGIYRYAKTTPRFAVKDIEIEGTRRLSREDILATSGIKAGENLFSLNLERAQKALVKSPWIERARVTRRLPNGISIEVHEREARAVLVVEGKSFLIDADGYPFKEVGLGDPHDLTLITGVSPQALLQTKELERERLRDLLGLIRGYEHLAIAKSYPAEEIHVDGSGNVTLMVGATGTALHLGRPPFKQRLLRAERVLQKTLRKGAAPSVVFLDNEAHPERVVVRVQ